VVSFGLPHTKLHFIAFDQNNLTLVKLKLVDQSIVHVENIPVITPTTNVVLLLEVTRFIVHFMVEVPRVKPGP